MVSRIAVALAWILFGTAAHASVITFGASQDNTLYEPFEDKSNGAGQHFFVGHTDGAEKRRGLILFDVAGSIPSGSTVNSASLTLHMSRTRAPTNNVSLHRLLANWGEGNSDASAEEGAPESATSGDATWTYRLYNPGDPSSSPAWTAAGANGDFVSAASATTAVGGDGSYTWGSTSQMVADVQGWVDTPAGNFGWIVVGTEAGAQTAKRFDTRENGTSANRPQLTVDFTPPATPGTTGACCPGDGSCTVVLHPGTSCTGTYQGEATVCDPNPCPQPTGACCLPTASATCTEVTASGCSAAGGDFRGETTTCTPNPCPVVLEPFVDALPIPAVAQPISGTSGGVASYNIAMRQIQQQLHRDLPPTTVWGYGDSATGATFPGPTIEASSDQKVTVAWINDLRDSGGVLRTQHILPVDNCMHGAEDDSPRTVVHLHGAHVQPEFDGYPESTFLPGQQAVYEYANHQLPATLWYHDHALGITRLNVYMGMAGFYLIRDAVEAALNLPAGEFEIPIVIQDRAFNPDGSLMYPAAWQEHFFGDKILVNGKVWPFLEVKQGKYRLRLLNGSNSRTYTLSLSNSASFQRIGTGGGLLPAPVAVTEITLGPAERADVIIDFAPFAAGTEIILVNSSPAPFHAPPGEGVIPNVMKFVVTASAGHTAAIPSSLRPLEVLQEADSDLTREFVLRKGSDPCTGVLWLINDLHWDDITEYPELGTTEIWSFINRSGFMHPMHMHLVMFQVLDRQPFDVVDGVVVPIGPPIAPPSHEAGWKDTVRVQRSEIVRVIARFESYTGKFPYHCHILEHEDHEMMRQFQTVQCGNNVKEPNEDCDDGNTLDGDCCSSTCTFEVAGSACAPDTDPCTNDVCDGAGNCTHTGGTCTPTHTPTHTPTQTPTDTPTSTPTLTQPPTASPSHTPTRTPTNTPTHTPTVTQAATATPTNTATQTATMTPTQTPTQTTSASPEPTARLLGSVSLEGLPDPPHASWVVPLDVGVFPPSGGAVIETWTPTTDESGNFTCDVSTPGSYLVCVKHAQRLQSCRLATLDPGSTPVAFGNLRAGDADNDNCVELVDFSVLVTTFGLCSGDTGFDQRADFDLSGCVVLLDFSLLASNFAVCGDEPASPATTL